jgi:hypothetical protein
MREREFSVGSDDAARGVVRFEVIQQADGRFHWELVNPHGTPMGRSMAAFDTEDEAFANAPRRLIGQAPVTTPELEPPGRLARRQQKGAASSAFAMGRAGIEPATLGLRVPCSTS